MEIFVSSHSLAWRTWLSSYGFSYSENESNFNNIDIFIDPEYNLIKHLMSIDSRCVVVLSDETLIKNLGINDIVWKYHYLDKSSFETEKLYTPSSESFVIRCGKVGSIDFITYRLKLNMCINSSDYKAQFIEPFPDIRRSYADVLNKFNKSKVFRFMYFIIKNASVKLSKPLVYIWRFPSVYTNVFNLRIDVDPERMRGNGEVHRRINKTLNKCLDFTDRVTIAFNFYKRPKSYIKNVLTTFSSLDLISHNYYHIHFPTKKHTRKNMLIAKNILQSSGINSKGFISPEYFWYPHVSKVIEDLGYNYASSFGYDEMNYPYRPIVNNTIRKYFEIPSDPCVYSKYTQMFNNDKDILDAYKLSVRSGMKVVDLPCFKYEHPAVLGRENGIFEAIMHEVCSDHENVLPITLTKFASWLEFRENFIKNNTIIVEEGSIPKITQKSKQFLSLKGNPLSIAIEHFDSDNVELFPIESENYKYIVKPSGKKIINKHSDKKYENNKFFQKTPMKDKLIHIYKHHKKLLQSYFLLSRIK